MDRFIKAVTVVPDGDLAVSHEFGVAYQTDMGAARVPYDADYLAKCRAYEGNDISNAVNAGRCALLMRHLDAGAAVLDIGAGSGAFVRVASAWGLAVKGFDVIPETVAALRAADVFADDVSAFDAVTMWDVVEHVEDSEATFVDMRVGAKLFVSVPVFADLADIRKSRHYRPGEHLYYWTDAGFIKWMSMHSFLLVEQSDHEVKAGRDSIAAFAFVKKGLLRCQCGERASLENFYWPGRPMRWFVKCWHCETSGPNGGSAADAVSAWNSELACSRQS